MRGSIPYLGALFATSLKSALALRAAFWTQVVLMALNDVLFFCIWWIFFARYPEVRGWTLHDMYAGYGFVALAFGVYTILADGTRDLAARIVRGDLDGLLTQPRAVLPRIALSRSSASAWGDVGFGILLLALSGRAGLERLPAIALLVVASALVLTATAVIVNSLAFWFGELDGLPRQLTEFVLVFSLYPSPLFTGALRVVLFTLLPAGFVGFLPAEWLHAPSAAALLATVGGAAVYMSLATWIFHRGLRHYESGNRMALDT
jgi:ABC-2 type transport system permease protein